MDITVRLRQHAKSAAEATQFMAQAKSARNQAAGDKDACYLGLEPEQTIEWKAADEIERLRAALAAIVNECGYGNGSGGDRANDIAKAALAVDEQSTEEAGR